MIYISIDESGSMTSKHSSQNEWFCISMVVLKEPKKLKRIFKRWISRNFDRLKELDSKNKMFDSSGKFKELKSSLLMPQDKINLLDYLCKNNYFEVLYIKVDNAKVNDCLYDNTARAFNYILGLALRYYINGGVLPRDSYHLYIDERNTKTKAKNSLEDYLNILLCLDFKLVDNIRVEYQESHQNNFIQIADFFANLYFSRLNSNNYDEIFDKYIEEKYLNTNFSFPPKNS
jgi:hypothetical protein